MDTLVIYGGRFQPFHKGHMAAYKALQDKFNDNVFVASANHEIDLENPFAWDEKRKLAIMAGLPKEKFIQVKHPYQPSCIQEAIPFETDNTILILALSEKDSDRLISKKTDSEGFALRKDGKRSSLQKLRENPEPLSHGFAYVTVTPTVQFEMAGSQMCSASEIRNMYAKKPELRKNILIDMYGEKAVRVKPLFDKRLSLMKTESTITSYEKFLNRLI